MVDCVERARSIKLIKSVKDHVIMYLLARLSQQVLHSRLVVVRNVLVMIQEEIAREAPLVSDLRRIVKFFAPHGCSK